MTIENCCEQGKNNISVVLYRTAELRKGKTETEMSQSDGMKQAWKELKEFRGR